MRDLQYTVTDLPALWPGKKTLFRKAPLFKSTWTKTLHALAREIGHLGGRKVEFACEIRMGDLRQDGQLHADARPGPAVIVSFLDREGARHAYPCDTFKWWQDNLHAIAVVLEDLRRAERYGVQSSLLRAGFKALPASTRETFSTQDAALVIARESGRIGTADILTSASVAKEAVRSALYATHPDRNAGDRTRYDHVDDARKALSSHHGVSL